MKSLPIGNDDFKDIRKTRVYYVDKTHLIEDILSEPGVNVFLFTRPRRFGKTLNLSMLDAYFNIRYAGNDWFDGLKISKNSEYGSEKNFYPTIFISLKDLNSKNYESFLNDLHNLMMNLCTQFEYLPESDISPNLKNVFSDLYYGNASESTLKNSLRSLYLMLKQYHGKNTILLIDEYDNPLQNSCGNDSQDKIISFVRGFLSPALKSNDDLKMAVVTEVMQIAKESIFFGLNNLNVNNVFSSRFNEAFGFTEKEVSNILTDFDHSDKLDEIRKWMTDIVSVTSMSTIPGVFSNTSMKDSNPEHIGQVPTAMTSSTHPWTSLMRMSGRILRNSVRKVPLSRN